MTDRSLDLLADLARLLKRYGAADFARLSAMLSDPALVGSLRSVLEGTVKISPVRPEKERAVEDYPLDPNLQVLRRKLTDASAFPHLRDLVDEAQRLGVRVPPSGFKSRQAAVTSIVKHFEHRPQGELALAVEKVRVGDSRGSLQEWSAIITNRRP